MGHSGQPWTREELDRLAVLAAIICPMSEPCVHCYSAAQKVMYAEDAVRRFLVERPRPVKVAG